MANCNTTKVCEGCGKSFGCSCQCVSVTVNNDTKAYCKECAGKTGSVSDTTVIPTNTKVSDYIKTITINNVKWDK